jgi:putative DNA primase/helicase
MHDFIVALEAHGLLPRVVVDDGLFHRCATVDKPRKKNGAFKLFPGGTLGVFRNYATDADWNRWQAARPMSVAERRRSDAAITQLRHQEARRRLAATTAMRAHWATLQPLTQWHGYLDRKGVSLLGCNGLRLDGDDLVIPVWRDGALISLQTISMDGQKRFRAGCPVKGGAYRIYRPRSTITCFVEGFATGLTIFQSIPTASVEVCFDASNLVAVARESTVTGLAVVCADNDLGTAQRIGRNPGLDAGIEAAQSLGAGLAYPEGIRGSDWNDALAEWGSAGAARLRVSVLAAAKFVRRSRQSA